MTLPSAGGGEGQSCRLLTPLYRPEGDLGIVSAFRDFFAPRQLKLLQRKSYVCFNMSVSICTIRSRMKHVLALLCGGLLLTGCTTDPWKYAAEAPHHYPNKGAKYRPTVTPPGGIESTANSSSQVQLTAASVAPTGVNGATLPSYEAVTARCQYYASTIPFIKTEDHDPALSFLTGAGWGAVAVAAPWWPVIAAGFGTTYVTTTTVGIFAYAPDREKWHQKQENSIANCVTRAGYTVYDTHVAVTAKPASSVAGAVRPTGRDSYVVEKMAKQNQCSASPVSTLKSKGPGYEIHTVPCSNGQVYSYRCEFGNCRASEYLAAN